MENYDFIEIEEIIELEEVEDTYDITVENTHNFFANGLLVHNCLGGIASEYLWKHKDEGFEVLVDKMTEGLRKFQDLLGDRFYGEMQWNNIPEQHLLNKAIIKVSENLGFKLISTCDSHYPRPDAWREREVYKRLGWVGKAPAWMDERIPESVEEIGYELYPKNAEEMWKSYKKYSNDCGVEYDDDIIVSSITTTAEIAFNQISDFLPDTSVKLPSFVVPAGKNANDYLTELCEEAMRSYLRGKDITTKRHYQKRLEQELDVIISQNFSEYFLTTKAIIDFSWEYTFVGPGRGSACGSLIAFLLKITQIDPMVVGLPFERFLTRGDLFGVQDENSKTKEIGDYIRLTSENGDSITLSSILFVNVSRNGEIKEIMAKNLQEGDVLLAS